MKYLLYIFCFSLFPITAGCASSATAPVDFHIHIATDANPDDNGRPSPVVLTIVELADDHAFREANYLALLTDNCKLLGATRLNSQRLTAIAPGKSRQVRISPDAKTRYIGVIAELAQFNATNTRVIVPASTGSARQVDMIVDISGIALASARQAAAIRSFNEDKQ